MQWMTLHPSLPPDALPPDEGIHKEALPLHSMSSNCILKLQCLEKLIGGKVQNSIDRYRLIGLVVDEKLFRGAPVAG